MDGFSATKKICRKLHRWGGLFLTAYILFYSLSGIMLNHRQAFSFFLKKDSNHQKIQPTNSQPVMDFINYYKAQINRSDSPKVIRLHDGGKQIEFLYGFHGQTTYIITPATGDMEVKTKHHLPFLYRLSQLHKAFKTSRPWLILSDSLSILLCLVTLAILFVMRYRPIDIIILIGGVIICLAGAVLV
jgi:hypothetical protein